MNSVLHFLEQALDRKIDDCQAHDPGFELVDVEQLVEHARHRAHRLIEPAHQLQRGFVVNALFQHALQQADRLQGLAQIMAGGGEKARLADVGPLGLRFCGLQHLALALRLGDVDNSHQDLALCRGLLSKHASAHQERAPSQARQFDLDLMILDGGASVLDRGQEVAERRHIEMIGRGQKLPPDKVASGLTEKTR